MSDDAHDALARTAQLLRMDVFGNDPARDGTIVDGLRATTVRLVGDRRNLTSYAGQTAFITLHNLIAMLGVQIEINVPAVEIIGHQPPLRPGDLGDALRDYTDDLIPGGSSAPAPTADLTIALGDSPAPGTHFRISGAGCRAAVTPAAHLATAWTGDEIVGALAAAAAGSIEAVRAAMPTIATMLNVPVPTSPAWSSIYDRTVHLNLDSFRPPPDVELGAVDVLSGGAITNAAMYTILRADVLRQAELRVIEPDIAELSNLNRYALLRRSLLQQPKTAVLADYATNRVSIIGAPVMLDDDTANTLKPFASHMLVGVDDIPSRWTAQRNMPHGWVYVGASSHDYVLVSAHPPDGPCAGCTHPKDEPARGTIPTISFASFWAGFLLALKLLRSLAQDRDDRVSTAMHIWPLGLDNPRGIDQREQGPTPACPVTCAASVRARTKETTHNPSRQRGR
jgi:hypothetical protein